MSTNGAVAAATTGGSQGDDAEAKTPSTGKKDKFLPRVRLLLTKEYEKLLRTLIDVVEEANCAQFRSAAVDNAWADAFERLYASIQDEFVRPNGKNRIHKFKSKVVDCWAMMEVEIEAGEKSPSDPTYATAMRQWSVHQSVMKNPDTEATKTAMALNTPKAPPAGGTTSTAKSDTPGAATPAALTATTTPMTMTISEGAHGVGSSRVSMDAPVLERLSQSVTRLERMMVLNGWAQPKLPNPLNELHYLKGQMAVEQFDQTVRETYEREIKKYLSAARHQARMSNTPAYLPGLLDGLDSLRSTPQSAQLMWTIKETYDFVLRSYIKLLDPIDTEATTPRKRKRDEAAAVAVKEDGAANDDDEDEDMQEENKETEGVDV